MGLIYTIEPVHFLDELAEVQHPQTDQPTEGLRQTMDKMQVSYSSFILLLLLQVFKYLSNDGWLFIFILCCYFLIGSN